ncbi:lipoprotein signal peptidase [Allofrancisella guangzhouensis]|uniref:Lipoprotein signal peptidase n=1 Tax=Allofrancisella guangzhouensis TaxID=594679 RepID=A0A0A8E7B2_9GAMM|nr:signal peptidase II [Allofrancisella guangzhouensis]AJC49492.1 peptidase A8 [Allofrancisella guangzhouensis]MBK2027968.1 lipoprotein signal peptidase [Allofrancisella guangzhouensis]MBK2043982.1 lipoprotein signal peptidase [Allofrancisella guangzhouensis]MBK2045902.1 lipoprotein signal peptidase [Allofrancisella guangzhouensis]
MLRSKLKYFGLAVIIIALDLYTKYLANINLNFATPVKVTSFFNLTLLYNYGAAFSFLSNNQTSWQLIMFSIISLIAAVILIYLIMKQPMQDKLILISFSLILGGALGNFYDRAFRGFVIDFLDFHINNYHWPAFNIADSAVTCGVTLIILRSFSRKTRI